MVAIKPHCNVNDAVDHFVCTMTNEFYIFIIMSKCHCPTRPVRTLVSSMSWYSGAQYAFVGFFYIFSFRDIAYENNLHPGM